MATATVEARRRVRIEATPPGVDPPVLPRWAAFLLISGLYLTLRGYHAFDGDQAYRLPLLLHWQDPALYADDPFVRAIDAFNPHRGYLTLIDWASRPFGLATALAGLFGLTLAVTIVGVDRLAHATWPGSSGRVGLVAVVLVLAAKAGNIGTNHLFEATLLDRLVGFALGWLALAATIGRPGRGAWLGATCLGLASLIHPSVGLQLALTLAATWGLWWIWPDRFGVSRVQSSLAIAALGLALSPSLLWNAGQAGRLFDGLVPEEFRLLAVSIQGPQHMLPSTWRLPQWLAWGCYPVLALLALGRVGLGRDATPWTASRIRLASLMGVNLASLGLAYLAVEVVGDLKVTIFQPFRMATLARGLALVAVSGRLVTLWARGDLVSRGRAILVGVGLGGDWMFVVATAVDAAMAAVEWANLRGEVTTARSYALCGNDVRDASRPHANDVDWSPDDAERRSRHSHAKRGNERFVGLAVLSLGLVFLAKSDTESGQLALLAGIGTLILGSVVASWVRFAWNPRRVALAMVAAWAGPVAALAAPWLVKEPGSPGWSAGLVGRWRFAEVPADDLERLSTWCRDHTPASSRFIGPPGPKTFRLWSRRPLAFNRAGSPYHAEGLADWASRFRDHVGFRGSTADFARAYLDGRHDLEAGFGRMTDAELADLARRQGATHVLVASTRTPGGPGTPLERLRVEGRYAVERVRSPW